jgi:hypothetical protein
MSFCTKCGGNLIDGVCPKCTSEFNEVLMSPNEEVIYMLGERGAKRFALISDKRLYVEGEMYKTNSQENGFGKYDVSDTKKNVVELNDITAVNISKMRSRKAFYFRNICAFFFLFMIIVCIITRIDATSKQSTLNNTTTFTYTQRQQLEMDAKNAAYVAVTSTIVCFFSLFAPLIGFIVYAQSSKKIINVELVGGKSFGFKSTVFDSTALNVFLQHLNTAKANAKDTAINTTFSPAPISSGADELTKYANLLEQGLISRDDYERQKEKILQ